MDPPPKWMAAVTLNTRTGQIKIDVAAGQALKIGLIG